MHEPIHHMFRASAERFADLPAIRGRDGIVTYRELAAWVRRLAAALLAAGARRSDLVAILSGDAGEVIAAMLGALEAGCAFMPLAVDSPARLDAIAAEVVPAFALVAPELGDAFAPLRRAAGDAIRVLPLRPEGAAAAPAPPPEDDPDRMCYVYFTSGSTGRPKAIAGRLKAIDHFVRWEVETLGVTAGTRVSQLTSPAFDAFLRDAFVPLVSGGTVCLPADRELLLDGGNLAAWLESEAINLLHCTPSVFRTLLHQDLAPARLPDLRHVLLAGEALLPTDVARWRALVGGRIQLVNLYGPSETTMTKLFHVVSEEDAAARTVPIGKPMPGARAIVIDDLGEACAPGRMGEILIRTPYRTLGYLDQPELTRQVFIANPFGDRADDVVYKTGDLGRMRDDGSFEYLGRRDHQVKIRGIRLELGPIEAALRSHPAIADAAVVDRADVQGNRFLCAYFVLTNEMSGVAAGALVDHLRQRLAAAALPAAFVRMDALPRTLSGKIDRRALPDPGSEASRTSRYVPPRTPVEQALCGIFTQLLGAPKVGIEDDFFHLGGHSLLGTLLLSRIRGAFGVELSLRELFAGPTVERLAAAVGRGQPAAAGDGGAIPRRPRGEAAPLSFAQRRLWLVDQLEGGSSFYNVAYAFRLAGRLSVPDLERALAQLVRRHEVLRTAFRAAAGGPVQVVLEEAAPALPCIDLAALPPARARAEAARRAGQDANLPFDLGSGRPIRCRLFVLGAGEHVLTCNLHHIVADWGSMPILVRELVTLYAAGLRGEPSPLPELPVQFADFAAWQNQRCGAATLAPQLDYWRRQLAGAPALLALRTDAPRPAVQSFRGGCLGFTLPEDLAGALGALGREHGCTLFMTLLAGFQVLLAHLSGQRDVVVGAPMSYRNRPELEGLIGFFVNPLVLRADLSDDPEVSVLLARVRGTVLEAYTHQDVPFETLVEELAGARSLAYNPLVQVAFNYIAAAVDTEIAVGDLKVGPFDTELETAQFDLTLTLLDSGPELQGAMTYKRDLFAASSVAWWGEQYARLLRRAAEQPSRRCSELLRDLQAADGAHRQEALRRFGELSRDRLQRRRRPAAAAALAALAGVPGAGRAGR